MDYSQTVRLPKTDFAMRGDLPKREPAWVQGWLNDQTYEKLLQERAKAPEFHLHDGPPFANGDAHVGHALNMVLKDIVLKSRSMMGRKAPFVPGWDCHGLPIEHKVVTEEKLVGAEPAVIRKKCEEVARHFIQRQKEQFQRLGVLGDWDRPYLTMNPAYEAAELRILADLVEKGMVYEGLRPVHWSTGCRTALAEAEVEYADREDESVYVRMELKDAKDEDLLIWTTTPWTLPANLAVAVHPGMSYVLADSGNGRKVWLAKSRMEAVAKAAGRELKVLREAKGSELEKKLYRHPLVAREGVIRTAEFVTAESGTGMVHIAPGHGHEDYVLGRQHGLEPFSPVNEAGKLTAEAGIKEIEGQNVFAANPLVADLLEKAGKLWAREKIRHSYPHCPRSKTPIVFRSVRQWFIRMDGLRDRALQAVDAVRWVPSWGKAGSAGRWGAARTGVSRGNGPGACRFRPFTNQTGPRCWMPKSSVKLPHELKRTGLVSGLEIPMSSWLKPAGCRPIGSGAAKPWTSGWIRGPAGPRWRPMAGSNFRRISIWKEATSTEDGFRAVFCFPWP